MVDREVIKVGGLVELQFYHAKTLWERMNKAGITRKIRDSKKGKRLKDS